MSRPVEPSLPAQPLTSRPCPFQPGTALARAWERARQTGRLTIHSADRICAALNMHPTQIWGDEWFNAN